MGFLFGSTFSNYDKDDDDVFVHVDEDGKVDMELEEELNNEYEDSLTRIWNDDEITVKTMKMI